MLLSSIIQPQGGPWCQQTSWLLDDVMMDLVNTEEMMHTVVVL